MLIMNDWQLDDNTRYVPERKRRRSSWPEMDSRVQQILEHLPGAKVEYESGARQLRYCDSQGVGIILHLTAESLDLRLPAIRWHGPAKYSIESRRWKKVAWDDITDDDLPKLLAGALQARKDEYSTCRSCGQSLPLGYMYNEDVCYGCSGMIF